MAEHHYFSFGRAVRIGIALLLRSITIAAAWAVAWIVYMIAMMVSTYDGALSLIFQPIMAAISSTLFVGVALLVGLVFRIPFLGRAWRSSWRWAALLVSGSVLIMCFGSTLGLTSVGINPDTKQPVTMLHPVVGIGSYFLLIFSIANWPILVANGSSRVGSGGSISDRSPVRGRQGERKAFLR